MDILVALARGHIVFCRRDIARVMMALRVEFDGREHPVGNKVADIGRDLAKRFGSRDLRGQTRRIHSTGTIGEDPWRGGHRGSRRLGDSPCRRKA